MAADINSVSLVTTRNGAKQLSVGLRRRNAGGLNGFERGVKRIGEDACSLAYLQNAKANSANSQITADYRSSLWGHRPHTSNDRSLWHLKFCVHRCDLGYARETTYCLTFDSPHALTLLCKKTVRFHIRYIT